MDKWIRGLASVDIIRLDDDLRIIQYNNSVGDRIEISGKQIIISVGNKVETLDISDIKSVDMNPMFKQTANESYLIIRTSKKEIRFLVDTRTNGFHDLPTVYDYLRRISVVG